MPNLMKLIVVASSSKGNAYALDSGSEILLIEAGIKPRHIIKAIDYQVSRVVGCIVSHNHGDHAKYVANLMNSYGFRIGCSKHVARHKEIKPVIMESGETYSFGSFRITPFDLEHDVPCLGYLVYHPDMGTLLFATDTYTLPYQFKNVDNFLIEANYSDDILNKNVASGDVSKAQATRLMVSHMSIDNCIKNLKLCDADRANNIILVHLSERNSDAEAFRTRVMRTFGVPTYIADKNTVINLNNSPI